MFLGLDLDRAYLKFFEAHFDSVLHDSMSAKYRMFGSFVRPIGQSRADGECCARVLAIQRLKHAPSKYSPQNLSSAIANTAEPLPVIDTQSVTGRLAAAKNRIREVSALTDVIAVETRCNDADENQKASHSVFLGSLPPSPN